jgi:hypothetical protein
LLSDFRGDHFDKRKIQPFFMKKSVRHNGTTQVVPVSVQKTGPDNVWCEKFGYFIDLDACRARSFQKKACRLCFSTRIQLSLPFD